MTRPRSAARRVVLLGALTLGGCSGAPAERVVHVAAAMSLKEAFTDLEAGFEAQHPGVDVVFNFAGSQTLAAQIVAGAPADVFASADRAQMERAAASSRMQPARVFARNKLVIVTPANDPSIQGPADLSRAGLRLILAGETVPVGAYAREALNRLGVREAALANVVSNEENVRGVVGKVATGEADAGIVYATDVTAELADKLRTVTLAGADDVVPAYEIAALADSRQPELAAAFVDLVAGPAGAAALGKRGFLPP
ncbi:molybdate ABC transporter substrate-binding protein [Nannocystis bainbridge]|uniref:Molybdate ABC transporter substrate-binding protein n=1 Tax=Nannocystis bainbridge TaxID=2995303 RepID=A0ABT5DZ99_9BACT|nr:molybdate ABC transporter substrate-binding protein [Nannocystis bainbridge]MDC0717781.1 molybdate ABC transporter substrate-binding protein [Nannocystis bainbridge]